MHTGANLMLSRPRLRNSTMHSSFLSKLQQRNSSSSNAKSSQKRNDSAAKQRAYRQRQRDKVQDLERQLNVLGTQMDLLRLQHKGEQQVCWRICALQVWRSSVTLVSARDRPWKVPFDKSVL